MLLLKNRIAINFQRESYIVNINKHNVKVQSMEAENDALRVAHVPINVTVLDINDNAPMFVNLPYYAIVSIDAKKDDLVTKVSKEYNYKDKSSRRDLLLLNKIKIVGTCCRLGPR